MRSLFLLHSCILLAPIIKGMFQSIIKTSVCPCVLFLALLNTRVGCCTIEHGFAGDIGDIEMLLIDPQVVGVYLSF